MSIDQKAMFQAAAAKGLRFLPNLQSLTVRSIDPDSGATITQVGNITGNRSSPRKDETPVGDGVVLSESCRFRLIADGITFAMKTRDQVIEEDGTIWSVVTADYDVYSSRWVVEVTRNR